MKRFLTLLIVAIMLLSFTACGNNEEKTATTCWNCGETISETAAFCASCGSAVADNPNKTDSSTSGTEESGTGTENTNNTTDVTESTQSTENAQGNGGTKDDVSAKPTITASSTSVSLKDSSKSISITVTGLDEWSTTYDIANEDIVYCEWGEWDYETCSLTFTPLKTGNTIVTVFLDDHNKKVTINVSVQKSTPDNSYDDNPSHTHSYSKNTINPTCTELGYTVYTCACGHTYNDNYKPANGHAIVVDEAVAATTTSTGLTRGEHCSVCQKVLVEQEIIPKLEPSPAEQTKLTIEGIGNTYSYYLPTEKKSSTYIHSGDYKVATIGTTYIELQVDIVAELTYANWNNISFRYELHDSNGVCVKTGTIHKSASKGTKYNIHMTLPVSEAGNYTLKFFDIKP